MVITVRNSSWGKVMFSQASVILSGGAVCMAKGGVCGEGGMHGKVGHVW